MRFIYFLLLILATLNLLIFVFSGLTGINIYKKYGKSIIKGIWQFIFLLVVVYTAMAISGLGS